MQIAAVPIEEEDYGGADAWIRHWIENAGLQNTDAIFPQEMWNMCDRVENQSCRTNNSTEGWHRSFNALFRAPHPPLSTFVKVMSQEDMHWQYVMEDFNNAPNNGIRGKGMGRKSVYVEQDTALLAIFNSRAQRQPWNIFALLLTECPNAI
ncbi:hypothetical protein niasHT_031402 [Heterodera trifolii]|uniref:MULE transposase domain-containing protein n=1 Tax=Heterodera trifolii TaxID=157864 RepID=A0ABD2HWT2_9BILA